MISEIEALYRSKIEPRLEPLEAQRKKLQSEYIRIGLGIAATIILIILLANSGALILLVPVIIVVVLVILRFIKANKLNTEYRTAFKSNVVAEILNAVNPSWTYDSDRMIGSEVYWQSDIFRTNYDRYAGDDFVSGVIEKTDFECSELHTQYKQVTYDSKGRRQEHWVTIFRGLFFHADFNKEFKGRTYVSPDVAEKMLGKFGQKFQSFTGPAPLVKLENIEFEKEFVVHATDQIEARYILTPTIMEAILRIKKQYNCEVHFSFVGSRVYCALSISKNLFEPKIFGKVVDLDEIENMYTMFKVNEVIIHELNLNTRIWTKT
jgi:hypothetical protein